jgi:putative ABC transport system permease protein
MLVFTVGISLAASLLFGIAPAIRSSKFERGELLARSSGLGSTGRRDAGHLLIVSEVALAAMLLIGAVVAARSTRVIDPAFFRTMRVRLVNGRAFETGDADEARGVVVVSEAFARRFFPNEESSESAFCLTFREVTHSGIRSRRTCRCALWESPRTSMTTISTPAIHPRCTCLTGKTRRASCTCWCARKDPLDWAAAVRGAVLAIDRDEPVFDVKTLEEIIAETFSRQRTFGEMLSAAAGLALVPAATGIYALMAWAVSRRTREIGIRMAIGAAPSDVIRLVLRRHWDRQSQAFFLV